MEVDPKATSTREKTKTKKAAQPLPSPQQSGQRNQGASTSTSTAQGKWTEVVGRKAAKAVRAADSDNTPKTDFPPLPPTKSIPIAQAPTVTEKRGSDNQGTNSSFFEETVRTIHESVVNPDDFGQVTGIKKTRGVMSL